MDSYTRTSINDQLHQAIQEKKHELSELDLMLADYHFEHSRLIRELLRLRAQLIDDEENTLPISEQ